MALVPHRITALAESDAQGTDGKNIVAGAVCSLYDTTGTAVTLFDDAAGTNGSTAKTTDAKGQVVVWVTPGEYDEEVNGSIKRRVAVGSKELTTEQLIDSVRVYQVGDVITTTGFSAGGDGGAAQWKVASTTGLTPSQTPADRGAAELADGSGRLWEYVSIAGTDLKEINPLHLGASTDISDNTLQIQAAINSAEVVFIPAGVYDIAGTLIVNKGMKIYGHMSVSDEGFNLSQASRPMSGCTVLHSVSPSPVPTMYCRHDDYENNNFLFGLEVGDIAFDGDANASIGLLTRNTRYSKFGRLYFQDQINYGMLMEATNGSACIFDKVEYIFHKSNINRTLVENCVSLAILDGTGDGVFAGTSVDFAVLRPNKAPGLEVGVLDGGLFKYVDSIRADLVNTDPSSHKSIIFRAAAEATNGIVQKIPCRKNSLGVAHGVICFEDGNYGNKIDYVQTEFSSVILEGDASCIYDVYDFSDLHKDSFHVPNFKMRDTISLPASMSSAGVSGGSVNTASLTLALPAFNYGTKAATFSDSSTQRAGWFFDRPFDWNNGTISARGVFTTESSSAGDFVCRLLRKVSRDGDEITSGLAPDSFVTSIGPSENEIKTINLGSFTINQSDDYISIAVDRYPNDASDTFAGDIKLLSVQLDFIADGPNSVANKIWDVGPMSTARS